MPNYGIPPVALGHGEGCRVWDADGREYLDLIAGIAVSALGHAPPGDRRGGQPAGRHARAHLQPVPARARGRAGRAAARRCSAAGRRPGVLRQLRHRGQRGRDQAGPPPARAAGRPVIVAAEGGFHGRTMGALALTGKSAIREPFGPFGVAVRFVPYGDAAALRAATRADCAAVFLEPSRARAASCRRPPVTCARPARRATRPARCWSWTRSRAASAAPALVRAPGRGRRAGRAHAGQGPGRRAADRRVHRPRRRRRPRCARGITAARSAATRSPARPRWPCWTRSRPTGCWPGPRPSASSWPRPGPRLGHPLLRGVRGRGLWLAAVLTAPRAAEVEAAARPAGLPGQRGAAGRGPAGPAADPDAGRGGRVPRRAARHPRRGRGCRRPRAAALEAHDAPPLPARRRPQPGRAGRRARPGRPDEGRPVRPPRRWPGRRPSPCCSTSRPPAPGSRSRSASPSSAASR